MKNSSLGIHFLSLLFCLMTSSLLTASQLDGGWTSGGGEIQEDAHNPWFIKTYGFSSTIGYCIDLDDVNFGVNLSVVRDKVLEALSHWRADFQVSFNPNLQSVHDFYIAENLFVEKKCSNSHQEDLANGVLLRFQFGHLTDWQWNELRDRSIDPRNFVGLTIREGYNRETLEGHGYIYIGPSRGPLKFVGVDTLDDPWARGDLAGSYNFRLLEVIKHELGHVFGIPHTGDQGELMSAGYPELLVSKGWTGKPIPQSVFANDGARYFWENYYCYEKIKDTNSPRFFQLPLPSGGIQFQRIDSTKIAIYSQPAGLCYGRDDGLLLGYIHLNPKGIEDRHRLVTLWIIPEVQNRFPKMKELGALPINLPGPMTVHVTQSGFYQRNDSTETSLTILYRTPRGFRVGGVLDGILDLNLLGNEESL